jgi:O-6-methylguanine DNA methyltransferase
MRPSPDPIALAALESPLGTLLVGATPEALVLLVFERADARERQLAELTRMAGCPAVWGDNAVTRRAAAELTEYFDGERRDFTVPLQLRGTPFQVDVWESLRRIPYGQTWSYGRQARSIGRPRAVRAVARANGANRISLIVPCHRVIGADGSLTGYGAGVWRKERLLALERRGGGAVA